MAKDPAVLWYWNDWHGGTITFSRHLKGCYMDLLHAQFNSGRLSLDEIKTVLGTDFGHWPALQKKFAVDNTGKYFNERLDQEQLKRKQNSAKQSENAKKRWSGNATAYTKRKPLENEDENEIENGFYSTELDLKTSLTETEIINVIEFIRIKTQKTPTKHEILDHWEAFKINQFGVKEWYKNHEDLIRHFRNALKKDYGTTTNRAVIAKPGTSQARVDALKKW